jgi:predicted esterase
VNNSNSRNLKDVILVLVFIVLLAIPGYLSYKIFFPLEFTNTKDNTPNESSEEIIDDNKETELPEEEKEEPVTGPHFEEMFEIIEGQMAYISVPTNIDLSNPPKIVVYNHGSNTRVTNNLDDLFIQDLQLYGERFTNENLIFAASNAHDENWGNTDSINDIQNMIFWIKERYETSDDVYMIGFSMGALPTTHYLTTYPANVKKVALLAPTTRTYEWDINTVNKVPDTEIKIWHGIDDVNIGIVYTDEFVEYMKKLGKDIELVRLKDKAHFDLDTEYMEEILKFFQES